MKTFYQSKQYFYFSLNVITIDQNFDIIQNFIVLPVFEYQQGHYFYYVIG